ncbi:MAG: peptidoglycan DD-metalloendopeptidase family protein [Rhodospirillaceae bacterium]|nr:peptidoglycan DD-metalloendopeptidase family protein [Rhodospirillaceae bacterium]
MDSYRTSFWHRAFGVIAYLFRERQVILRSDARVRYFRLTTAMQLAGLAIWIAIASWIGFATVGLHDQIEALASRDREIGRAHTAYGQLLDKVSDYQISVVNITRDLKETQSHLKRLFGQNQGLKQHLSSTEAALRLTEAERDRMNAGRRALDDQLELLGKELRRMSGKNNALESHIGSLRSHLASVTQEKAEIAAERREMDDRIFGLMTELEDANMSRGSLEENLGMLRANLRVVMVDRGAIASENDALQARVATLEDILGEERDIHRAELEAISNRALSNIKTVETVLRRTGLKLEKIAPMPQGALMGQGGPFIPYHPDMKAPEDSDPLASALEMRLSRWEQLRELFISVPLISPIKKGGKYYLSSRFGRRKDPFNRRWGMHYGVDLAAHFKTPVVSTAPGQVTFAGWRSRYGRAVDVSHGNGLMTRYAHLSKIKVKKGQAVDLGQVIGLVGSTGRSSGPHVHYEIRHKDKALNPRRFLRAGRYVQTKG